MTAEKWYFEDRPAGRRLDEVRKIEAKRSAAQGTADQWADERDEAIRRLLADGAPVRVIVAASGLSRARIYQIRDRRR